MLKCLFKILIFLFLFLGGIANAVTAIEKGPSKLEEKKIIVVGNEIYANDPYINDRLDKLQSQVSDINIEIGDSRLGAFNSAMTGINLLLTIFGVLAAVFAIGFTLLIIFGFTNLREIKKENIELIESAKKDLKQLHEGFNDKLENKVKATFDEKYKPLFENDLSELKDSMSDIKEDLEKIKNPKKAGPVKPRKSGPGDIDGGVF